MTCSKLYVIKEVKTKIKELKVKEKFYFCHNSL